LEGIGVLVSPETKIFLKVKRKKYRVPVNPSEISVTHGTVDKTEQVAGVGEILIPQKPGLMTVTWNSFFPSHDGDPYVTGRVSQQAIAKALEKAWKKRQSCRLVITRSGGFDTNIKCRISDYKYTDKGGEPGDLYYEITLKEYRSYGASQMTVVSETATGPAADSALMQQLATGPASDSGDAVASDKVIYATAEPERPVDNPVAVVGANVVVNGDYYYSSLGASPHYTASGLQTTITRIVPGADKPYHVGGYGWVGADAIQLV
jgi:hypothetical protein